MQLIADSDFFSHLNEQQKTAVMHDSGALLIVAGAGSGKTRVITTRIAYLLQIKKVLPSAIIALTFTNKAAREMKDRVALLIGNHQGLPYIGTFHAYCVYLLRRYGSRLNLESFTIIDEEDQKKVITGLLKRHNLTKLYSDKSIISRISFFKSHCTDLIKDAPVYLTDPIVYTVYQEYEREKKVSKLLDFDDLLHCVLQLFEHDVAFRLQFQQSVRHILVDEYQDTNAIQRKFLMLMAKKESALALDSVCAVGDEDQSIYSWRGATVENMLAFVHDFSPAHVIKIEQNYRSVQPILSLANTIIMHNSKRTPKNLWSNKKGGDRIRHLSFSSQYQEAEGIVCAIKTIQNTKKQTSVAILYRTHFQSRAIEEALIRHAMPYTMVGGVQFYERKEIKDMLAFLRLVANPFDYVSCIRMINVPARGLGPKFEEQLAEQRKLFPHLSCLDLLKVMIEQNSVTGKKKEAVASFIRIFCGVSKDDSPQYVLQEIIQRVDYRCYIKQEYDKQEAASRLENIQELLNAIAYMQKHTPSLTIESFLHEVALMQDSNNSSTDQEQAPLFLMTLHAAKGLEFDYVIVAGLEEGILPSTRSLQEVEGIEEERRLLYVGITRAREWLLLSYAKTRFIYGSVEEQRRSRFLEEIPETVLPLDEMSFFSLSRMNTYFSQWILRL